MLSGAWLVAGPEQLVLWHAVQQPGLQDGSCPQGVRAGGRAGAHFRWGENSHRVRHLPLPADHQGPAEGRHPQVWPTTSPLQASSGAVSMCSALSLSIVSPWNEAWRE